MNKVKITRREHDWGVSWRLEYLDQRYGVGISWAHLQQERNPQAHVRFLLRRARREIRTYCRG